MYTEDLSALVGDYIQKQVDAAAAPLRARVADLERIAPTSPDGWEVLYETSFDTNDGWELRRETQANDNSYNTPANVLFGAGLSILGKREALGKRPYTSGDVLGRHIRVPNYFRAEVTATLPTDAGMWPCPLWFRPLTGGDSGEIDVCETWPFDWAKGAKVWATVWENYTGRRKENASLTYAKLPYPDPTAPHVYAVEKTQGRMSFTVDGVPLYTWEKASMNPTIRSWYDSVYEIEGREWYPRVTLQIGGPNAGDPPADWTSSRMTVHRLRIFKEA